MKKYYILSALLMLAACENQTEEFFEPITPETKLEGVVMSIPQYVYEAEEMTRTTITPTSEGMSFAWKEGDKVGVYATGSMANFDIKSINEDATSATFDGGGFSLTSGSTYYAFYPYNGTATEKAAVPVNYLGQEQLENGSYSHLSEYDYMVATATATATDEASFNFAHLGSIMRFKITVPEPGVYKSLVVKSTDSDFVEEGNVDLTASTPIVVPEGSSDKLILSLGENSQGISLTEDNLELTAYILTAPANLSGKTLEVSIFNESEEEFSATVEGKNMQAGGAYAFNNIKIEGDKIPYVTFHAEGAQSLTMSKAVETLEYSVNGCPWTELGTTTVDFGGDAGDLRLRGKNLNGTALSVDDYSQFIFGYDTEARCAGDIRTLLDYENFTEVQTNNARFCSLFKDCNQLITAPELPIMTLADHCYYYMFGGCSSLLSAPELPADNLKKACYRCMFYGCSSLSVAPKLDSTDLGDYCYWDMFSGCSSLITAPELPATNLSTRCYGGMFENCSSLKTAPELPATHLTSWCYLAMFAGCTSLTTAPELPAPDLDFWSYEQMFRDCINLKYVKMNAVNLSLLSLDRWLSGVSPTGTFVKNAAATWDERSNIPEGWTVQTVGIYEGHEYVDLGLPSGTLWATCNIGARTHFENGFKFAWGEIEPKEDFSWNNYKYCNHTENSMTKYGVNMDLGIVDNKTVLELSDDAANVNWGNKWRMPTRDEYLELEKNCTISFIREGDELYHGVNMVKFVGPNGNNLFFIDGENLWTSNLAIGEWPSGFFCSPYAPGFWYTNGGLRYAGISIRPVFSSSKASGTGIGFVGDSDWNN